MDRASNPFRPGAGRRPPLLAGREELLDAFDVVRRRAEEFGEGDRSWVLSGLRGVGKTVLLTELLGQVSDRGWITAKVEASQGRSLAGALSSELIRSMRSATGRHPEPRLRRMLGVFRAFSVQFEPDGGIGLGVDVAAVRGVADTGRFASDLTALCEVMGETGRDLGVGVLILIDELQEATAADLVAVNTTVHRLGQGEAPLPVMIVGAGLPSLPATLADATSYAERLYDYLPVGLLDAAAARRALAEPVQRRGANWDERALEAAVRAAAGYPYLLQAIGKHVWDYTRSTVITGEDVEVGLRAAQREVDDGLYRSRWERATPAQQELLRAVARVGADRPVGIAQVAKTMNRRTTDLSVARGELIKKGLLYAPLRGQLAFTVPGMHEFIGRQP